MTSSPAKAPGKILGVPTKWAVVIVLVVFVGVWYYLKNRSTGVATQTQTTPQVADTGSTDSTGGVSQSPDLSSLLDALAQNTAALTGGYTGSNPAADTTPTTSNYYNAPYNSPTTDTYTYNYTGATPPVQQGQVNDAGVPAYSSYTSLGVAAPTGTISAGMAGGPTGAAEVKLALQQAPLRPSVGKNVPQ